MVRTQHAGTVQGRLPRLRSRLMTIKGSTANLVGPTARQYTIHVLFDVDQVRREGQGRALGGYLRCQEPTRRACVQTSRGLLQAGARILQQKQNNILLLVAIGVNQDYTNHLEHR